ncbi:MAG TPA: L-threonylcarbamoyladenylate synthase [Candidatus Baltobacteraceae bacterium]|nr:L-threonylcarbamoyladenylate synthase [Candidatus Baltobacteraceae bacterium]
MNDDAIVARAVEVLRHGGLVAIPTETVYGLAADAANPSAVARLYAVKGRPADHPLILHVHGVEALDAYVATVSPALRALAARFWPGPLTVVVARGPRTPLAVTGGQETVAVRAPAHPLARAILARFGGALVAPSANRFGRVSPTTAEHVREDLGADVDLIVDGGPATVGVESTIVDLSGDEPALLRAGAITAAQLAAVLGREVAPHGRGDVRAPGTLPSHYAPRASVVLVAPDEREPEAARRAARGERVAVLALADEPARAARELYASLRALDAAGYATIVAALPPDTPENAAVRDRLTRAAAPRD